MHIPENYLAPASCAVMTAAMIPVWIHAAKKVKNEIPKEKIPMLGVGAAFSFLGMMFNIPLIGGTTGHAVGGTLIALLFGPNASCIAVSIALLLQAVIFGDGGILSFGANCFNMAFVLPYLGYAIFQLIIKIFGEKCSAPAKTGLWKSGLGPELIAAAISSYAALCAAAFCCASEFGIQPMIFKDAAGNALYCPYDLSVAIPAMMIPHLAVAGIAEAIFTVAIYAYIRKTAPELIYRRILLHNLPAGLDSGTGAAAATATTTATGTATTTAADTATTTATDTAATTAADTAAGTATGTATGTAADTAATTVTGTAAGTATTTAAGTPAAAATDTNTRAGSPAGRRSVPIFALIAILIAATPLGLLATGTAWGEWGADEISTLTQNGTPLGYTPSGLANGWSLNSLLPDYTIEGVPEIIAYILSAILGVALLIIIFKLLSIPFKAKELKQGKY